ncbi:hypothetical protein AAIR98_001155 [Elusimicrobium simillimum]|uniref:hypothetical protein n=1 Tax=Elusimicrobium simillimum TaxID=3143438 RepID=UPI003C6FCB0E
MKNFKSRRSTAKAEGLFILAVAGVLLLTACANKETKKETFTKTTSLVKPEWARQAFAGGISCETPFAVTKPYGEKSKTVVDYVYIEQANNFKLVYEYSKKAGALAKIQGKEVEVDGVPCKYEFNNKTETVMRFLTCQKDDELMQIKTYADHSQLNAIVARRIFSSIKFQ